MHPHNNPVSEEIFEQVARIGKSLAHPKRLELIELLGQAPRTVDTLSQLCGMSQANTSQHLKVLKQTHLVDTTRDGTSIWYRLTDDNVAEFFRHLRTLAVSALPELDRVISQYLSAQHTMDAIDRKTLLKRARNKEVTVLDVRPYEEYLAGHIPGAISIPIDELELRLGELPKDQEIVAYCRGPYCIWSGQAVNLLQEHGLSAQHLVDGVTDWRAHGHRVAIGAAS